ncbi:Helicase conserved C-terminal domain-containing protein [Nocardioides scoriae]|uniref:Helicase conserved C-terminal domain-containing protein n=1 Tax=Nocardioides scoriae TaxID=642780 RepID=A0A1H1SLH1_9ACTN|nr:DEAD/DEAH box helicase [Nocardioides scoriae]SDS48586.1 Helicase conserved C-terminal domain-containing protein [Nocardioides scoriae]
MRLLDLLPDARATSDPDALYDAIATWVDEQGLSLYPAQDEALIELVSGNHVILSTPTGTGKSLVALAAHAVALAQGRRTFYTAPIKALVSEKFFALIDVFGASNVGMLTGDASINSQAPIICCTAEVLANIALREGASADVGQVVMDEFHFYAEPDRGWAWQVPLIELTGAQFLLMSATLGDVSLFEEDLTRRTGRPTAVVTSATRPVPLSFEWALTPLHETIEELLTTHQAPAYVVHFTQASALERAQALTSINVATREEKDRIAETLATFRFSAGFGRTLSRLLRSGIGVHHAGMLPKYRRLVEQLAQAGLLKVICGTDTLGVGINVPIRTVVFTGLTKYDGHRQRMLKAREFHQIAGRAGRAGFDTAGTVVVQAPEHAVENHRLVKKAGDDPKKLKRVQRKKPPEGQVTWNEDSFERLVHAEPEALVSRMRVTHSMLLNVIARPGDPAAAMRHLLRDNHEDERSRRRLMRLAAAQHRALLAAGVVELVPREPDGRRVRLAEGLQLDFALNQPLSAYALDVLDTLDPEAPTYALDVVSVIEATLDDPRPVLGAQEHLARGEAIGAMKAEGIEYEERMELLEEVTHPQPLQELLEHTFSLYRAHHPWVGEDALSPKAVVRDVYERAMGFGEYVAFYGLTRSEGLVLRYLGDAYRALRQTVPDRVRTDELDDIIEWLGAVVRQTDSSLLDEWETLNDPALAAARAAAEVAPDVLPPTPERITANVRAFTVLVRNAMFRRVELASRRRVAELVALEAEAGSTMTEADWDEALAAYFSEHDSIDTGADARGPRMLLVEKTATTWEVQQVIGDPEGYHDWRLLATVDLTASDDEGELVLDVTGMVRL